ncbi:hypothetical protein JL722_9254 [Aureococcus anophagefferens]|nr:hypothetical protein JL722_9254 [Aureococcus anophagefferens]
MADGPRTAIGAWHANAIATTGAATIAATAPPLAFRTAARRRGERREDRDRRERRDERRRSRSRDRHRRRDDDRGRPAPAEKPPKPEKRDDSSKSRSLSWSPPPAVRRQMAEAKARKKREAAAIAAGEIQPAQKSGKFWDGFRWVEHTPASQMPSNPATRKERRLYVGNLPQTFDSEQLRIFLNEALRACGAIRGRRRGRRELVGMPPGAGGAEGGVAAQPGASYAPGYGPDAAAGNEEFINGARAMASGNPPG